MEPLKQRRRRRRMRTYFRVNYRRLDLAMDEQKVTAAALGRAAGHADHSYICRMRRGEKRSRSVSRLTAERIAEYLRLPLDWLFVELDKDGHPVNPANAEPAVLSVDRERRAS